jgi:hypothetical protein
MKSLDGELWSAARREMAQMNPRVRARAPKPVLFGRNPHIAVGLRWTAHDHRTEFQPRREEAFPAQAQVAAWSAGRAERERVGGLISVSGRMTAWHEERVLRSFGRGPYSASGHFTAWRVERVLRERAMGRFPFLGRISQ